MNVLLLALLLSVPAPAMAPARPDGSLSSLKKQAELVAEDLREEPLEEDEDVSLDELGRGGMRESSVVDRLLARLGRLQADPRLGAPMRGVLARLAEIVRTFPDRWYAKAHPAGLVRAMARELDRASKKAATPEQFVQILDASLRLPERADGLPKDIALADFKDMGGILIFLLKQRPEPPTGYLDADPGLVMEDRYHVGIGVKFKGRVEGAEASSDGDYTFNVRDIHCEINQKGVLGGRIYKPQNGDYVEVRGWTYFDLFHEDELGPEKDITINRKTIWEIHPVEEVVLLQKAKRN